MPCCASAVCFDAFRCEAAESQAVHRFCAVLAKAANRQFAVIVAREIGTPAPDRPQDVRAKLGVVIGAFIYKCPVRSKAFAVFAGREHI